MLDDISFQKTSLYVSNVIDFFTDDLGLGGTVIHNN